MRSASSRARAGILLAATLLPLSALAQTEPRVAPEYYPETPAPEATEAPLPEGQESAPPEAAPQSAPEQAPYAPPMDAPPPPPAQAVQSPPPEAPPPSPPPVQSVPARRFSLWRYSARPGATQFDLGGSLGFNSPSGIYGVEGEWRMFSFLGVRVSGGQGVWGTRVGPQVRLYPLGEVRMSPFVEAGVSLNFGGELSATDTRTDTRLVGDMLFTPVGTLAVGSRLALGRLFFVSSRVGWAWRWRQDNFRMRDGGEVPADMAFAASLAQHHGLMFSGTLGMSFF